ncbi:MAG: DUF2442 domain-containing protein [Casimicrobiaceae bacterium]
MKVKSTASGTSISDVEVTNVPANGFWVLVGSEELHLPFALFSWFRDAPVIKLSHVTRPSPDHLYWPELDIDPAVDSIRHPDRFPLVSR